MKDIDVKELEDVTGGWGALARAGAATLRVGARGLRGAARLATGRPLFQRLGGGCPGGNCGGE